MVSIVADEIDVYSRTESINLKNILYNKLLNY